MPIYVIGTLDTKGPELAWVRDRIVDADLSAIMVDAGCVGEPNFAPDVSAHQVFAAAGSSLEEVRAKNDRGNAVTLAAAGVTQIVGDAAKAGTVDGIIALGGSAGTTIGTSAMRDLPLHIPKVMVSTMASGQTRPYVGGRNILMMNAVADIAGINRISRIVLGQAVSAIVGMVRNSALLQQQNDDRPIIAATMFGVTTPCVTHARKILESAGYEVVVFHATGNGGESMEGLIRDGVISGVLDITTTELADELVGGVLSAGPDRLTAAADAGIPQVISVGALDMVNFGARDTVPEKFSDRTFYEHNANVTLMRTTMDESQALGEEIGSKASAATGPVSVLFPSLGVSAIDVEGQPFDNGAARMALWHGLQSTCKENVDLSLHQNTINDPMFAEIAATKLLDLMER